MTIKKEYEYTITAWVLKVQGQPQKALVWIDPARTLPEFKTPRF
jgi:hypothetical protein